MTSHPLCQTSHPLYLCHHNLSTDLIPTFIWHHTYSMCDIIWTPYNITSTPYVITLLYLWHHSLYIWNHIHHVGQNRHYTCNITAPNLCHHTHCIDIITPTVCMTSHSEYVWHILHCTSHYILNLWHETTIFVTSHPLYLTSYPLYMCDHIDSTDNITPTVSMRSHLLYVMTSYPLYMTSQPLYLCHYTPLLMISHPFCVWHHSHYIYNILYTI